MERGRLPDGFRWIDADDALGNVFSFLRHAEDGSVVACVANFSGAPHEDYRLGLPFPGAWEEVLNTDAYDYAGSGVGNLGTIEASEEPRHGLPYSATMRVPPLGTLWLRHPGALEPAADERTARIVQATEQEVVRERLEIVREAPAAGGPEERREAEPA